MCWRTLVCAPFLFALEIEPSKKRKCFRYGSCVRYATGFVQWRQHLFAERLDIERPCGRTARYIGPGAHDADIIVTSETGHAILAAWPGRRASSLGRRPPSARRSWSASVAIFRWGTTRSAATVSDQATAGISNCSAIEELGMKATHADPRASREPFRCRTRLEATDDVKASNSCIRAFNHRWFCSMDYPGTGSGKSNGSAISGVDPAIDVSFVRGGPQRRRSCRRISGGWRNIVERTDIAQGRRNAQR
ncbi:hypothetical protein MJ8_15120 [Mesorhizobium sp. J8]|nr:hypothetical protein MJ8_15120 [Mesorhizobium sp. J8]